MKKIHRICDKCAKKFIPFSKYNYVCMDCMKPWGKRRLEKNVMSKMSLYKLCKNR